MMAKFGWPEGHGEKLRKERREFARETASALAKTGMAEVERSQLGETKRAKLTEAGRATRGVATEEGKEARHLREFGPEGFRRWEAGEEYESKSDKAAESKRQFDITEARLGKKALPLWESYSAAQKKLGKTDTEIVESFKRLGKIKDKTPSPVTWTTASKNISNRFGKQDALGNIIITPELQGMNRIAQKKLVELQKTKEYEPLDAVNISEDFARNVENRYWEYLDATEGDEDLILKVENQFRIKYGYVPKRRAR